VGQATETDALPRQRVVDLVILSLRALLEEQDGGPPTDLGEATALIGHGAVTTSLGLVSLVVELEQVLAEEHGLELSLTDERAMSQTRSPFRTVGSLVDYIVLLAGAREG
jgi:hypothetical protein